MRLSCDALITIPLERARDARSVCRPRLPDVAPHSLLKGQTLLCAEPRMFRVIFYFAKWYIAKIAHITTAPLTVAHLFILHRRLRLDYLRCFFALDDGTSSAVQRGQTQWNP